MGRDGVVSNTYTGERNYTGRVSFAQGAAGTGGVQVIKDSQNWYVDSGKTSPAASGNGLTWDQAFYTLNEAIAAAGANDIIYIAKGDYTSATTLAITQSGLTIIGSNTSRNDGKTLIYTSAAVDVISVDANNVSIYNVSIAAVGGAGAGIAVAGTSDSYKLHLEGIKFDGWSSGTYGIACDATQDQPDLTVVNCLFRSWQTAAILSNATRGLISNNMFWVVTQKIGIQHVPTTGTRPDNLIADNYFCGLAGGGTTTGIAMTGTPTAGNCMIVNNRFSGSWDVTIEAESTDAGCENYEGTTTGGSLIDCNSSA